MVVVEGSTATMKNASDSKATDVGSDWLSKQDTATRLGVSLTQVTRYQKSERLTPKVVEGINYYDPAEVALLREEVGRHRDVLKRPVEDDDSLALGTIKACVGLIREPREKIDEIQFQIIDGLRKRVDELEAKLDASKAAVEAAKDATLERNLAVKQVESEHRIKELAMGRMVDTVGKLITGYGKDGVSFTPAQLEELLLANDDGEEKFLTPEQVSKAKEIVAKSKASTNGKAVVASVASAAKTIVDAQGSVSP